MDIPQKEYDEYCSFLEDYIERYGNPKDDNSRNTMINLVLFNIYLNYSEYNVKKLMDHGLLNELQIRDYISKKKGFVNFVNIKNKTLKKLKIKIPI